MSSGRNGEISDEQRRGELERDIYAVHAEVSALLHEIRARERTGESVLHLRRRTDELLESYAELLGLWLALVNPKQN